MLHFLQHLPSFNFFLSQLAERSGSLPPVHVHISSKSQMAEMSNNTTLAEMAESLLEFTGGGGYGMVGGKINYPKGLLLGVLHNSI